MNKALDLALKVKEKGGRAFYVGGYVRDFFLHNENKDIDIEVHGLDEDELLDILHSIGNVNYYGKSFGIFAIEGENIEVALPRSEKVLGKGHRDFIIKVDKNLGYKEASIRRDFTINALMMDIISGEILDFFGGREDLEKKIIRHIDENRFKEDPLRVFRACQFAARFDFSIDEKTIDICKTIDITSLSHERIEEELKKALIKSKKPSIFFSYLKKMNINSYFNELNKFEHLDKYGNNDEVNNIYFYKMALIAIDNKDYLKSFKQITANKELLSYVKKMVKLYNLLFKDKTDFIMEMFNFEYHIYLSLFLNEDEKNYYDGCYKRYLEVKDNLINGKELLSWGFKADKNFGNILDFAKRKQIEGLKKEEIRAYLMKIFTKR